VHQFRVEPVDPTRPRPTALLSPSSDGKPEAATAIVVAPDDGREDARNMLSCILTTSNILENLLHLVGWFSLCIKLVISQGYTKMHGQRNIKIWLVVNILVRRSKIFKLFQLVSSETGTNIFHFTAIRLKPETIQSEH